MIIVLIIHIHVCYYVSNNVSESTETEVTKIWRQNFNYHCQHTSTEDSKSGPDTEKKSVHAGIIKLTSIEYRY